MAWLVGPSATYGFVVCVMLIMLIISSQQSSQEVQQLRDKLAKGTSEMESLIQSLNRVTKANQTLEQEKADIITVLKV